MYRGCKEKNLKIMEPRLVNHSKEYVYGTTDKNEAIIYSVKGGNYTYTNVYGYDDDGSRCLIERIPNYLEKIYNVEGRYYVLPDDSFIQHTAEGVGENEYVSEVAVGVLDEVIIPNVWNYFCDLEQKKLFKIYRYPNRPKNIPQDDSDLIEFALIAYKQCNDFDMTFGLLMKYHPKLKEKIEKLNINK